MDMTAITALMSELEGFDTKITELMASKAGEIAKVEEKYKSKVAKLKESRTAKATELKALRDDLDKILGKNRVQTVSAPGTVRAPAVNVAEELVREVFDAVRSVPWVDGRPACTMKTLRDRFSGRSKELPDHKIQAALLELRGTNHVITVGAKAGMRYAVPADVTTWARERKDEAPAPAPEGDASAAA